MTSKVKAYGETKPWAKWVALLVVVLAIAALCVFLLNPFDETSKAQGASSIREAVLTSANQCFAIEGAYPKSIDYLRENYGLVVNTDDYLVVYELFADNISPNIMVTPR